MLETENARIDIRRLDSQVSWDAQKYAYLWGGADSLLPIGSEGPDAPDEGLIECTRDAAALSNVESPDYTMRRYRAPLRWFARIVAKVVLYFGRIITHAQTHFNYHVVAGLEKIQRRFDRLDDTHRLHSGILGWLADVVPRVVDQVSGMADQVSRMADQISRAEKERLDHGHELEIFRECLPRLERDTESVSLRMRQMEEQIAHLTARLSLQERTVHLPTAGSNKIELESAGDDTRSSGDVKAAGAALDGLYMVFEDHFRGSRKDILGRLGQYLPLVKECISDVEERGAVIDLGCGRGEWLELLASQGVKASGIDINPGFLMQCEQFGSDVIESDALEYLSSLPDDSVSIVSGFHIIEHFEFSFLVRLIEEVLRVLHRDGMVIFETPNPKNLIVGACNFYADPTHVRQVFPELLEFVMQSRGFRDVELRYLNPHAEEQKLDERDAPLLAAQLNALLSCARDFAVVARK